MATPRFRIPDVRSNDTSDYPPDRGEFRRGRMKQSWHLGVAQRSDGSEAVTFDEGLTWGSIGQLLGYLLGEVNEAYENDLYDRMEKAFWQSNRGEKGLQAEGWGQRWGRHALDGR